MKKWLSIGSLLLFLFPSIVIRMHAFSHEEEEHCAKHEANHLNEKHHNCKICEFNCDSESEFLDYSKIICKTNFYEVSLSISSFIYQSVFLSPFLRAPPMAC